MSPDTVLVRLRAAGVNPMDGGIREGYLEGAFPIHFPLVPGWDAAGVVEAVGAAVTAFEVGDEVTGYVRRDDIQYGTYAELVPAPERTLAEKPVRAAAVLLGARRASVLGAPLCSVLGVSGCGGARPARYRPGRE